MHNLIIRVGEKYCIRADVNTKTVTLSFNDIRIYSAATKDAISFRRRQTFTLVPGVLSLADFVCCERTTSPEF